MTFLRKVFWGLRQAGLSEEKSLVYAEMIERKERSETSGIKMSEKVAAKGDKVSNGGTSLRDDIIAYGKTRKGNVFTLAQMSSKLGVPGNNISAQLTYLVKEGIFQRTGRGEYVCNRGTC